MYTFRVYANRVFDVVVDQNNVGIFADFLESNKEVTSFTVWTSVVGSLSQQSFGFGDFKKWKAY